MKRPKAKPDLAKDEDKIYSAALRYLSRRDYAEEELRAALQRRGGAAAVVEAVLCRLKEIGYIDDARFARGRVRSRREVSRRGRNFVRYELRTLGVAEQLIEDIMEEEYDEQTERQLLMQLAVPYVGRAAALEDPMLRKKEMEKIARRLLGKGFSSRLVFEILSGLEDSSRLDD